MIDLIVVNYRTPGDLNNFLFSTGTISVPYTVTVVNVAPLEEDIGTVNQFTVDSHIVHEENIGYAKACNHAARLGSSPYIAFFNADTRILPGAVENCIDVLSSDSSYAIAGPRQVDGRGRISHAGVFGSLKNPMLRGWQQSDNGRFSDVCEAVSVSGSAYFIKRDLWDVLTECPIYQASTEAEGAFLPTQHYYEETWCSYHAQAHGYKVLYVGTAKMVHLWHRASPIGSDVDRRIKESQMFFRKVCDEHLIDHD